MHFLDSRSVNLDDPNLRDLHELLIRAYDDEVEALALAGQVGLVKADIARYPKLRFTWQSILEEAAKEGQLRRMVGVALQDPTIEGWHGRIRQVISAPPEDLADSGLAEPDGGDEKGHAGQQPEIGARAKLWPPGTTVAIRFLDGSPKLHAKVAGVATEWLEYANIEFAFGDEPDAAIRVSFEHEGSWSYLGHDSLSVARDQPTMNLGWLDDSTDEKEVRRAALQNFGHVLGLQHEHGNPASTIEWNRPAVYELYSRPPFGWTRAMVDHNVFAIWPPSYFPVHKVFDRQSIMMFPLPGELLKGPPIGWNNELSPVDKQFAAALYPIRDAGDDFPR